MKTLSDGTEVSSRTFYYLLDFNDQDNWNYIREKFDKTRLSDLTIIEYAKLFEYATKQDFLQL